MRGEKVKLHTKEVQDIAIEFFKSLCEGDILFIDSSHVSKLDSDVNYLYLEVLPALKTGTYRVVARVSAQTNPGRVTTFTKTFRVGSDVRV